MVPNLDLILLAFLHGSFISCILLLVIFLTLICLLLAFSISLFSIVLIDSYHIFSFVSLYIGTLRANVELGFAIGVFTLMHFTVNAALDSKPSFEGMVTSFRLKAQHAIYRIKVFMLAKITHQL